MKKERIILTIKWIAVLGLAVILVGTCCYLLQGIGGEDIEIIGVELYVNGTISEQPAMLWTYGKLSIIDDIHQAQIKLPLIEMIEVLGGTIEIEEEIDGWVYKATIQIGDEKYYLDHGRICNAKGTSLFSLSAYPASVPKNKKAGTRLVMNQPYVKSDDFKELMRVFGFRDISIEVDEELRFVNVSVK